MMTKKYALTESEYLEVANHLEVLAETVKRALDRWEDGKCFPTELSIIRHGCNVLSLTLEDLDLL